MTDLLAVARELQLIAQAGLTYAENGFDRARYARLLDLAAGIHTDLAGGAEAVRSAVLAETGYATPKLDVRAVVLDAAGRVLLVREVADGGWTFPGGWADIGMSAAESVEREVWEEAGVRVRAARLLGLYERERTGHPPIPWFTLKAVIACELVGASPGTDPVGAAGVCQATVGSAGHPSSTGAGAAGLAPAHVGVPDPDEVSAVGWFTPAQARGLSLSRGRTSPWLLDRALALLADPAALADLD